HVPVPNAIWISSGFDVSVAAAASGYDLVMGLLALDVLGVGELRAAIAVALSRSFGEEGQTARAYRVGMRWVSVATALDTRKAGAEMARLVAIVCVSLTRLGDIVQARETSARAAATRV